MAAKYRETCSLGTLESVAKSGLPADPATRDLARRAAILGRVTAQSPSDSQLGLIPRTIGAALRKAVTKPDELRYRLVREVWAATKRFAATDIDELEQADVSGLADAVIETFIDDPNRAVVAALCRLLGTRTFFEIGTNRGRTAWTVARANPQCAVYTLDLPGKEAVRDVAFGINESDRDFFVGEWDRGDAYRGTSEEERITTLLGDSARFDFSPYAGRMDFVFVDGAHSHSYVENDTKRAFEMLAAHGVIAWDDYPAIPGVYNYLNALSGELDSPLYHVQGTRLVVFGIGPHVKPLELRQRYRQFAA